MSTDPPDHRHPSQGHDHDHHMGGHGHSDANAAIRHKHDRGHRHGVIDPSIASSARGLWAAKWSFIGLMAAAILQVFVVAASGSVALLADTIHNFADAATAAQERTANQHEKSLSEADFRLQKPSRNSYLIRWGSFPPE